MSTQRNSTHFNGEEDAVPEGLTPQQEQAAALLASGVSVQEVADRLDVHRSTLWHWRKLETFQAYFNALRVEAKRNAVNGVLSLQADAIETISRLMTEGSDSTALKAARYVLERTAEAPVGLTDAREMIRLSCTSDPLTELLEQSDSVLDEGAYRRRCEELNIQP